ncbi:nucleotidyltransferase domain-containing protein [Thiospirochaeta perfilievii]|uniref:Nucleotidyltransferase domain-containing protein n=1 Tax=Thiospirochaeta perfilievii TaxID=252967 RepID=A0A5C1Q975_9SPIO|nr:nucleotidyltransferase domain-containing protein [Thiospirochaeta perfilievii]QEN03366.1 nucleotidyltransferase domain-containing protein [Thiospirochaeta perfilievii]
MIQDKKLEKIRDIIIEAVHPDKIILFGSRARGTNRDDSDYDIFILKSGIENERVVTRAVNKALFRGHIYDEIDLIAANPEKFEKHKDNRYLVYKDINDQGVAIYG